MPVSAGVFWYQGRFWEDAAQGADQPIALQKILRLRLPNLTIY